MGNNASHSTESTMGQCSAHHTICVDLPLVFAFVFVFVHLQVETLCFIVLICLLILLARVAISSHASVANANNDMVLFHHDTYFSYRDIISS